MKRRAEQAVYVDRHKGEIAQIRVGWDWRLWTVNAHGVTCGAVVVELGVRIVGTSSRTIRDCRTYRP